MEKYILSLDQGTQAQGRLFSTKQAKSSILRKKNFSNIFQTPAGLNTMQMKSGAPFCR